MYIRVGTQGEVLPFRPCVGRTAFQTAYVASVIRQEDFAFACNDTQCATPYRGPHAFTFFTTDGTFHSHWVGQRRLLTTNAVRRPAGSRPFTWVNTLQEAG